MINTWRAEFSQSESQEWKYFISFYLSFFTINTATLMIQWSSVLTERSLSWRNYTVCFSNKTWRIKLSLLWRVLALFLSRGLTYICCTVSAVCTSGISPALYVEETRAHDISISNKKLSNTATPLFLKWILLSAIAVCCGAADKQLVHKGQTITETAAALQRDQGINP